MLNTVEAGGYVWIDSDHIGWKETRLQPISHVDSKGRRYICADGIFEGKPLAQFWRYGFDPKTGKSPHYPCDTMRYATPAEVTTELARQ